MKNIDRNSMSMSNINLASYIRERVCPHCGQAKGLYVKRKIKNVRALFDFNGNEYENCMDEAQTQDGTQMYCQSCKKLVCKVDDYNHIYGNTPLIVTDPKGDVATILSNASSSVIYEAHSYNVLKEPNNTSNTDTIKD